LTQAALARRIGGHQSWLSRIELGRGRGASLERWVAIGLVLGRPLAVSLSRPLGQLREPIDAGHLAMQEHLIRRARAHGRSPFFELPTRPADPSRSIDVGIRDPANRVLIVAEAWNTIGDLGSAIRTTHRKVAEAADRAAFVDDGPPFRVASIWVVRASAANRSLLGRYPEILRSAFPGPSRNWVRALEDAGKPPDRPGLVWFDPGRDRIHEWRSAPTMVVPQAVTSPRSPASP
jgi:hypothetical protein